MIINMLDFTFVVKLLSSFTSRMPWKFCVRWRGLIPYLRGIHFRVSHIFRKGNKVVDCLASPSREIGAWKGDLMCIHDLVMTGLNGLGHCCVL